jgi:hypothetical protein
MMMELRLTMLLDKPVLLLYGCIESLFLFYSMRYRKYIPCIGSVLKKGQHLEAFIDVFVSQGVPKLPGIRKLRILMSCMIDAHTI